MSRMVHWLHCAHCGKRIHGPEQDRVRAALLRHARNCEPFKRYVASLPPPPPAEEAK